MHNKACLLMAVPTTSPYVTMYDTALRTDVENASLGPLATTLPPTTDHGEGVLALIEDVYGPESRAHAEAHVPNVERLLAASGIRPTAENVPRAAEVVLYATVHASKASLYAAYDQNPAERSVYGF